MRDVEGSASGGILVATERRVAGWLWVDSIDAVQPLSLLVDGVKTHCKASHGTPRLAGDSPRQVVDFHFESAEPLSNARLFSVTVKTRDGSDLAPSPLLVGNGKRQSAGRWSLDEIDASVLLNVDQQSEIEELSSSVALLSSWFGFAIDRLNALRSRENSTKAAISDVLSADRAPSGTIAHLLGLVSSRYVTLRIPKFAAVMSPSSFRSIISSH